MKKYKSMDVIHRENIEHLAKLHGGVAAFAKRMGVKETQLNGWIGGYRASKTNPSGGGIRFDSLRKIEQAGGKETGWIDYDHTFIERMERLVDNQKIIPILKLEALAGEQINHESETVVFTTMEFIGKAFALHIFDEAMLPCFALGDLVVIDPAIEPRAGECVLVKCLEGVIFRQLSYGEKGAKLVPLNNTFSYHWKADKGVEIMGTMIEHRRYSRSPTPAETPKMIQGPDGYMRLTFETLLKIQFQHNYSMFDPEAALVPSDVGSVGNTDWKSSTFPALSLGWDWRLIEKDGKKVVEKMPDKVHSNIMLVDVEHKDLDRNHTAMLLEKFIERLDWESVVLNAIRASESSPA